MGMLGTVARHLKALSKGVFSKVNIKIKLSTNDCVGTKVPRIFFHKNSFCLG